jgi:hypothetical protein
MTEEDPIAEVLRRLADAVGSLPMRADGNLNQRDFYMLLIDAYHDAGGKRYEPTA